MGSLRWRLLGSYVLITLLTIGTMGALALSLVRQQAAEQEGARLGANARMIARQALPFLRPIVRRGELSELARTAAFLGDSRVRVLDEQHGLLADSGPPSSVVRLFWLQPGPAIGPLLGEPNLALRIVPAAGAGGSVTPQGEFDGTAASPAYLPPGFQSTVVRRVEGIWGTRYDAVEVRELPPLAFREAQGVESVMGGRDSTGSPPPVRSERVVTVPLVDGPDPLGFVELSGAPALGSQALETAYRVLGLAAVGALATAVAAALLVGRGLTEPLQSLAAAATRMGHGDLAARADVRGTHETRQLALQFNGMAGQLQASFGALAAERDALRRFIADASHELRTPITALKTFNELLRWFPAPEQLHPAALPAGARLGGGVDHATAQVETPPWGEFLQESATQIERLERVTHQLLDLSRLDGGLIVLDVGRHDAGDILDSVAAGFQRLAHDAGIDLVVRAPEPPLVVACDRARLETGLSNLVENALKHTPRGGAVELGAGRDGRDTMEGAPGTAHATDTCRAGAANGSEVQLWVRDTGCGIEPDEQARIFERFYRGCGARGEGSGLGLAIVQSVAHAHGGSVTVQSQPERGSVFTIALPPAAVSAEVSADWPANAF